jgi:GNAT superfamily N-acetyltransferase
MRSGFYNDINLSNDELAELKKIVRISHSAPWISQSIDGLHTSQTAKLCGVYANDSLASFAWYMQRTWIDNGISFTGLSIGVVTTAPSHRKRGYAKQLISKIEELARQRDIDFLYLAGIPGFYGKYGFKGFAPKSKLIFNKSDLPKGKGTISHLSKEQLKIIPKMHSAYSSIISLCSVRSIGEWEDLFGPLSSTFLFNQPKVVLNEDDCPIAYFCNTPSNGSMIREFVPLLDSASVIAALAIIANSPEHSNEEKLEIFAPAYGPIWDAATNSIGADFLCFLRPKASNMIKWISTSKSINEFSCGFILQGDML